jgi:hypothetical protein
MKIAKKYKVIVFLVFMQVFPATSVVFSSSGLVENTEEITSQTLIKDQLVFVDHTVIQKEKVIGVPHQQEGCGVVENKNELVQNTVAGSLLTKPANCFSLTVANVPSDVLSFGTLHVTDSIDKHYSIEVIPHGVSIKEIVLKGASPVRAEAASVPVVENFISGNYNVYGKFIAFPKTKQRVLATRLVSLEMLQVLRC